MRRKQPATRHDIPASIRGAMRPGVATVVDEPDEKARGRMPVATIGPYAIRMKVLVS